jgi:hypothetical protein
MANIPISVGGSWKKVEIREKGKEKPEATFDGRDKPLQITVTTNLDNRTASFKLPLGPDWTITIEESTG